MPSRSILGPALYLVAAILSTLSPMAYAQASPPEANVDWRNANEAVGLLKRGHADALRWEQANAPARETPAATVPDLDLMSAGDAVRRAWTNHRDLATPLAQLGTANIERIAAGLGAEVDPRLLRRVDDADEVLDVASQARKAWLHAVAARQVLRHYRDALVAAEAAGELAQRMADVGNWSRMQQAGVQIAHKTAQTELVRAEYVAAQAQADLLDFLQLGGIHSAARIPDKLPELPATTVTQTDLEQRLATLMSTLPRADSFRSAAGARRAIDAYRASHALAAAYRDVAKLREFVAEETVLHYNGMLKSVWELLDAARDRSQATVEAITAQRDFWIAEADLQRVLQGGAPAGFVALGVGASKDPAAAGH